MSGRRVRSLKRAFVAEAMAKGALDWEAANMWQRGAEGEPSPRRQIKKAYVRNRGAKGAV